jgi:hypothetical protein
MQFDFGRLFSNAFRMLGAKFLGLIGIGLVFTALQWAVFAVFGLAFFGTVMMGMGGFEDALPTMGVAFILGFILIYLAILYIYGAQTTATAAMASPITQSSFGDAMRIGLSGGVTMLGIALILIIASIIGGLIYLLIAAILSFAGSAGAVIAGLLGLFLGVYLFCRFAILAQVVAVDNERNPITALGMCWEMTGGHVLKVLVVVLAVWVPAILIALIAFGAMGAFSGGAEQIALQISSLSTSIGYNIGSTLVGLIFYAYSGAMFSALHSELSDKNLSNLSETFE